MWKQAIIIGIAEFALVVSPAAADGIDDSRVVASSMAAGGAVLGIGCAVIAALTRGDDADTEGYDRRGFYLGLSPSYAREDFNSADVVDRFGLGIRNDLVASDPPPPAPPVIHTFALDDIDDDSFSINSRVGYRCHRFVSAELQFEWLDTFDGTISEVGTANQYRAKLDPLVTTVNAKGYLLSGRTQPFLLAGVGFMKIKTESYELPGSTPSSSRGSRTDYAMRFGGGVDFYATQHIVASLEGSYVLPTGRLQGLDFYTFGLGMQYRF